MMSSPAAAATITYNVGTCIDGQDELIIHGSSMQWEYMGFTPVGGVRTDCTQNQVTVSTTLNGAPVTQNAQWTPSFSESYPGIGLGSLSDVYTVTPALSGTSISVTLKVLQGRESLTIAQLPTAANDETLILDFDDLYAGGSSYYQALVTVVTNAVPEPFGLALVATGLLGFGVLRRRQRT
jgi:hypothetical protein